MAQNPSSDEEFIQTVDEFTKQIEDATLGAENEFFDTLLRLHQLQVQVMQMAADRLKSIDDRVKLLESLAPRPDGDGGE